MSTEFPNIDFKISDIAAGRVIPHSVERKLAEDERRNEEFELTVEQNEQLKKNYEKLEQLCSMKEQELQEAKQDAKKAKSYNTVMLIISDENIEMHEKQEKIKKEISRLETQARNEKQPNKKFELVQKIN